MSSQMLFGRAAMAVAVAMSVLGGPALPALASPVAGALPQAGPASTTPLVVAAPVTTLALQAPLGTQSSARPLVVAIHASGFSDLGAWEFDLGFDPTYVEVVSTTLAPAFGGGSGCAPASARCGYPLGPWVDGNVAEIGGVTYGAGPALSSAGVVAWIGLVPRGKAGVTTLSITRTLATSANGSAQESVGVSTVITFGAPAGVAYLPRVARDGVPLSAMEGEKAMANPAHDGARPEAPQITSYCAPYDIRCDGFIDVRDLQPMANLYGVVSTSPPYSPALDLDGNGIIDLADLALNAGGWHSTPQQLAGGPPRLGYAVNNSGDVFLRWTLPISPYVAPVTVIRQDLSGTVVLTPVIAGAVGPIYDEALALSLLGTNWNTMQQLSFTTDISGVTTPATFTSVLNMHLAFAQNKGNLLAMSQLINSQPGVALVMGKGFVDLHGSSPVSRFWIRVRGRLLGPVLVDRTQRTIEPAPQNLTAFDASGYITTTDLRQRASQQRFAHGTIFLKWSAPNVGQFNPVWMYGYDLFRRECVPANPSSCTAYHILNDEALIPRSNTRSTPVDVPITTTPGANLVFRDAVNNIDFSYADRNLSPTVLYCYSVAARDLLGQSGLPTNEACLTGPDFSGPEAPQPVFVAPGETNAELCEINLNVAWPRDPDAVRYEVWRGVPPSGTQSAEWTLIANVTQNSLVFSTTNAFAMTGGYVYSRLNALGQVVGVNPVTWRSEALFSAGLAPQAADAVLFSRLTVTGAHPSVTTLVFTPTAVFTGPRSNQRGDVHGALDLRQLLYVVDTAVTRGDRYRYRIIPFDARGNMGEPSAPAETITRQRPGTCLPQPPAFGAPVNDPDVATVNLYRKFGSEGQPVLVSRIPVAQWNSSNMTVTDFFSPTVEMEVSYELRAENGYGETSLPGTLRTMLLTPAAVRAMPVAQPIIADAKITKVDGRYQATVDWVSNDNTSGTSFMLYLSKGITEPASYLSMTLVTSGTASSYAFTKTSVYSDAAGTGNITVTQKVYRYTFDNTDYAGAPRLNGKDVFWFSVGARSRWVISLGGAPTPVITSTARPAKYVARVDEPTRDPGRFDAELHANALQSVVSVEESGLTDSDYAACCYIVFRSRDGVTDWTPLSKPFVGFDSLLGLDIESSYSDDDDSLFDPTYTAYFNDSVHYKIVKLDAGTRSSIAPFAINLYNVTGEIVEASDVLTYTFTNGVLPGTASATAGAVPGSLPANVPKVLDFGGILVDVITATRMAGTLPPYAWQGEGSTWIRNNSGLFARVRVDFNGVTATLDNLFTPYTGTVTGLRTTGYADVGLGTVSDCYRVNRSNRVKYRLCDVNLDQNGLQAGQLILDALGADFIPWDVNGGIGSSDVYTFNNVPLLNASLDWTRTVTPSNVCGGPIADQARVSTHADWPLLIYPIGPMTYTHNSVVYGTACTALRSSRYSGINQAGDALTALDYDNNGFLGPNYTSTNASWSPQHGLTGTFNYNGAYSYTLAMPFRMLIEASDWRIRFENGRLSSGHIRSGGALTQRYFTTTAVNASPTTFTGNFSQLTIGLNGAMWGDVTGTVPLFWSTFGFTGSLVYQVYVPPTLTPDFPEKTWLAGRGATASGLDATGLSAQQKTENGGLNVFKRGLTWNSCAATGGSDGPVTFESAPTSGLQMYFRYGGATGKVNMPVPGGYKAVTLSGYETRITRFSQSWLDNVPHVGATLGDLFIPFPVSITLQMAGMTMNNEGCMNGGPVLPIPSRLDWWQLDVTPQAAEWRRGDAGATSVWLIGEYEIPNLTRVDGVVNGTTLDDPTVPLELSFKPNGDFGKANAYPQPTVYEIDGFYSVIESFALSDCNPKMANGNPPANRTSPIARCDGPAGSSPWNANATFRPVPTASTAISAYVDIVGSMVFPWFGEVISPSANHIYLLHRADYIGFSQRPRLEGALSDLLPIGIEMDLAFAQGKDGSAQPDGRWVGIAKQGAEREALLVMEAPYAAIITPDNTSLIFGFPALTAAALGAQQNECVWDATRCGESATASGWQTRWNGFRNKLGIGGSAYDAEWADAKTIAAALSDQPGTLTDGSLLDDLYNDMCSANGPACDRAEIEAWLDGNANSTGQAHARFALLRNLLADSPVQLQWLRGGVSIQGVRDSQGRLVGGTVGVVQLDAYATIFNRRTATSAASTGTTPMFDAMLGIEIDTLNNTFKLRADGVDVSLVGNSAQMNIDLDVYMGAPNGYGVHGSIELLNLHLELMTINEADADFGFTIEGGQLDELYLGVTFNAEVQTAAFGSLIVGGQFLVGRLDPDHPTLQEDYGDLFAEMDTNGNVIEGLYLSVYANNIPIVNIAGCLVAELSGGGGLAFWAFTDPSQNDTAWGTRISGFVQGKGGACLVALAVNVDLTLDNGFGEDETSITGDLFVAGGCGFCEPETWITEAGYENDKGCIKCGLTLTFIIPLDGSPAPYMNPEPAFSCSL